MINKKKSKFCKWCAKEFEKETSPHRDYCCVECKKASMKNKRNNI